MRKRIIIWFLVAIVYIVSCAPVVVYAADDASDPVEIKLGEVVEDCLPAEPDAASRVRTYSLYIREAGTLTVHFETVVPGERGWGICIFQEHLPAASLWKPELDSQSFAVKVKPGVCKIEVSESSVPANGARMSPYKLCATLKPVQKVTGIMLSKKSITIKRGKTVRLKAAVSPADAENKKLVWKSSNKRVAKVDAKGKVKGVKNGKAVITVKAADGSKKQAKCTVIVGTPVRNIKLDRGRLTLREKTRKTLTPTVTPANATNKKVMWVSSNTEVAVVTSKGVVKAKAPGKASVTALSKDGNAISPKCIVTVKPKVSGVELNKTEYTVWKKKSFRLKAKVYPEDAFDQAIIWTSSNPKVATVSDQGVVTGHHSGEATITVTTADGNKKATCDVAVDCLRTPDEAALPVEYTVEMSVTAYCSNCNTGSTSSGKYPQYGTLAAHLGQLPYGTQLYVPDYGYGTVEDHGPGVNGLDVYMGEQPNETVCNAWGRRYMTVYILEEP